MSELGFLSAARYGKDLVRVARVVRDGDKHYVAEYTVRVLLEGDIEKSYTKADNSCVVATDTMKNTVYILAKTSPHVLNPPLFALHLGLHFVNKYAHIHKAFIDIIALKWSRIEVNGKPHKWSFVRDGDEKGVISVAVDATSGPENAKASVQVGLKDLLVLKTSGSAFEDFYRDENTTLAPVKDRIFSTSVTLDYTVPLPPNIPLSIDNLGAIDKELDFAKIATESKNDVLEVFATDESASVQATLYNTLQKILKTCPAISEGSMSLPNKHYIPVNLSPFGLDNNLGYDGGAEVFHPVADPSGLITATVTRK
ncbi:uricase [Naematelia encephala]|uniref:Uricase n=1 Tax=Naematelia encephala TaxID=71784 RepID=A0A1Y2BFR3_9TREE|nr:uricase [Naematelia encephala]